MTDRERALLAWLSLEREAVWFYPLAGARVPALAERARRAATAHRAVRDRLVGLVSDDTTRAEAAYDVGRIDDRGDAERIAVSLERRIQQASLAAVRTSTPESRPFALAGLRTAALAELTWGGHARPYPGLDA